MKTLIAITGSNRPYIYDLPHILALPHGCEHRFRYRHDWVSNSLLKALSEDASGCSGQELILCFHSEDTKRVFPLRRCRVTRIESIGPLVLVRFTVGDYIQVPRREGSSIAPVLADGAERMLVDRAIERLNLGACDLSKPLPKQKYLFEAPGLISEVNRSRKNFASSDEDIGFVWSKEKGSADAWALLVALLSSEPRLYDVPLFYIIGFQKTHGHFLEPSKKFGVPDFSGRCGRSMTYRLVEGKWYRLRLLQWCTPSPAKGPQDAMPDAAVECDFNASHLQLYASSNAVIGKYDVLEFTVRAKAPGETAFAIALRVGKEADASRVARIDYNRFFRIAKRQPRGLLALVGKERDPPRWPRVFAVWVPIRVSHNLFRVVCVLAFGALSVGVYLSAVEIENLVLRQTLEMLATLGIFVSLGAFIQRFLKFNSDVRKFVIAGKPDPMSHDPEA